MGKRTEVSFKVSKADDALIRQVLARAKRMQPALDLISLDMDLCATIAQGNRLDLDRLLAADDFNFAHDVFGIIRHLDRTTGKLGDFFVPRFTKHKPRRWERQALHSKVTP